MYLWRCWGRFILNVAFQEAWKEQMHKRVQESLISPKMNPTCFPYPTTSKSPLTKGYKRYPMKVDFCLLISRKGWICRHFALYWSIFRAANEETTCAANIQDGQNIIPMLKLQYGTFLVKNDPKWKNISRHIQCSNGKLVIYIFNILSGTGGFWWESI